MVVRLSEPALAPFTRLSLFDSPYHAHRTGRAIDLYPGGQRAPSPVAGTVRAQRRVRAPTRSYAASHDVLTVIDTGDRLARIFHVDPAVAVGDEVAVGDDLGRLVRSGYFGPWVDGHVHLEFRPRDADPFRARGSVPIALDTPVWPAEWNGTGEVIEVAPSYVTLSGPAHPDPGNGFAGIAASDGGALDGGLVHYAGGGLHGFGRQQGPVHVLGSPVGDAHPDDERAELARIDWRTVATEVGGAAARGMACHLWQEGVEVTMVQPTAALSLGTTATVGIERRPSERQDQARAGDGGSERS